MKYVIRPKILYKISCKHQSLSKKPRERDRDIPDDQEETEELAVNVVSRPGAHIRILRRLEIDQLCGRLVDEGLCRAEKRQSAVGDTGEARNSGRGQRGRKKR